MRMYRFTYIHRAYTISYLTTATCHSHFLLTELSLCCAGGVHLSDRCLDIVLYSGSEVHELRTFLLFHTNDYVCLSYCVPMRLARLLVLACAPDCTDAHMRLTYLWFVSRSLVVVIPSIFTPTSHDARHCVDVDQDHQSYQTKTKQRA